MRTLWPAARANGGRKGPSVWNRSLFADRSPRRLKVTRSGVETASVSRPHAAVLTAPGELVRWAVSRLPQGEGLPDPLWRFRHRLVLWLLLPQSAALIAAAVATLPP